MKHTVIATVVALASLPAFAGSSAPALDQTTITTSNEASAWTVRMALYGWAQGLDGDIAVHGRSASVDLGFRDILQDLDFAVMGAIEVGRGRWSFMADINYAETSDDESVRNFAIGVENTQFLGNFVMIYQAARTQGFTLDAYAGVRVNAVDLQLDVNNRTTAGPDFSRSQDKTWVDPIIGGRFQTGLSENFFFRAVGDIGGFGIASDLTWQAMAGFGYQIMANGSLLLGYRGIGTDYSDGGFNYDIVAHGPVLGFECRF